MLQNYRKNALNLKRTRPEDANLSKQGNKGAENFKINQKNWIGSNTLNENAQNKVQSSKNVQNITKINQTTSRFNQNTSKINQTNSRVNQHSIKQSHISKKGTQSPLGKLANSLYRNQDSFQTNSKQKTPTQLMNDIFRGIGLNHLSNSKVYHSKQSQDKLCQLLSNKNKLNNFLKKLSQQISQSSPDVQKNYEILMTLLQQLNEADLQVHQDQNGIKICFNRSELFEKQKQIQRLQKQLQQKNKQTQKIVQDYEGVIRNFNDVIEKLIKQKKY